jgi:hypothetical protein
MELRFDHKGKKHALVRKRRPIARTQVDRPAPTSYFERLPQRCLGKRSMEQSETLTWVREIIDPHEG